MTILDILGLANAILVPLALGVWVGVVIRRRRR
jgi:hypothetical protein